MAGKFAPPQDSPARCCRAGWDCLPPEVCPSGPADSTGGTKNTQFAQILVVNTNKVTLISGMNFEPFIVVMEPNKCYLDDKLNFAEEYDH